MKPGIKEAAKPDTPSSLASEPSSQKAPADSVKPGIRQGCLGTGIMIIRHGATSRNRGKGNDSPDLIRGWHDIPLDHRGKKDAEKLADLAPDLCAVKLYSSDLVRAEAVAKAIERTTKLPLVVRRAFRPWNLGKLQGQESEKAAPIIKEHTQTPDKPVPGGESFNSFKERFLGALKPILDWHKQTGKNAIIVSHYRDLKLAEAWIDGGAKNHIALGTFMTDDAPVGSILRIWWRDGQWDYKLHDLNHIRR